ncbi:hypothetical protein MMC11_005512 [Xylographa trunciseda]|nr:hypothetical protein [Xylographa trunciseda]
MAGKKSTLFRGPWSQPYSHRDVDSTIPVSPMLTSNPMSIASTSKKTTATVRVSSILDLDEAGPSTARSHMQAISLGPRLDIRVWVEKLFTSLQWRVMGLRSLLQRKGQTSVSGAGRRIALDRVRRAPFHDPQTGHPYIDNSIRSSKYTLWTFLPRQLWYQFSKLANAYFLCVSVLQMIPGLSTTGTYTTIVPLMMFVSISMAKELWEDLRRHRLDKDENFSTACILCGTIGSSPSTAATMMHSEISSWKSVLWKNIRVGDIVRLQRNEPVPADLVILHVDGPNKTAFVETIALDGETNLKGKVCLPSLSQYSSIDEIARSSLELFVEEPNLDLYSFNGNMTASGETSPLTNEHVMYRGSVLRNTSEAFGIVVYSGEDCKIRMNATKNPRIKAPALQTEVNKVVILIVFFVITLSIALTISYQIMKPQERSAFYIASASVSGFPIFISFVILLNTMIPLSLYVSLEIVKLCQVFFMMNDIQMYDENSKTPMEARTSTINEELGQISYIFSDKTGTLTKNSMKFRRMSVAGTVWTHRPSTLQLHSGKQSQEKSQKYSASSDNMEGPTLNSVSTRDPEFIEHTTGDLLHCLQEHPGLPLAQAAKTFILSIALCHTCIPETKLDRNIEFQATSPDEVALLEAAKELGYLLTNRQAATVTLKISSGSVFVIEEYQILHVIEFTSVRKRMSVIVRMPDGSISLFCKGADSTIKGLLRLSEIAKQKGRNVEKRAHARQSIEAENYIRRISTYNAKKALSGSLSPRNTQLSIPVLRTVDTQDSSAKWLVDEDEDILASPLEAEFPPRFSYQLPRRPLPDSPKAQEIPRSETSHLEDTPIDDATLFENCFQHVNDFATDGLRTLLYANRYVGEDEYSSWDRRYREASSSLENRQEKIEAAATLMERNLELLGATAIEDKLQDGVPTSIERLRRANIKLWMLTGDKRETAVNIGRSCNLIQDFSEVMVVDHENGDLTQQIHPQTWRMTHVKVAHSVVVVDGQTLSVIEDDDMLYASFLELAILVDSVVCCRASPSQKASLVRSIRHRVKGAITLAIGDGSNDIAMIQEAHVGIGITGKEGLQAARTSDYSIAQFRFLVRLLLVHGRWNYVRTCKYTLGTFWKETLFFFTQALYQRYNGYTGTSLYESWSLSMFNTLFTSLPVIFMGIFEQDLKSETLLAAPELYNLGQRNRGFSLKLYLYWVAMALAEAIAVFFLMLGLYGQATFTNDNGLFSMGSMTFTACIVIIVTKMQYWELQNKTITCVMAMLLSIGGWFLWDIILGSTYSNNTIYDVKGGLFSRWGRNALWWLCLILIIITVWTFELMTKMAKVAWRPSDVDDFQQLEKDKVCWERIKLAARDDATTHDRDAEISTHTEEDTKREREVQELLARPRVMDGEAEGLRRRHSAHDGAEEVIELDELDTRTGKSAVTALSIVLVADILAISLEPGALLASFGLLEVPALSATIGSPTGSTATTFTTVLERPSRDERCKASTLSFELKARMEGSMAMAMAPLFEGMITGETLEGGTW